MDTVRPIMKKEFAENANGLDCLIFLFWTYFEKLAAFPTNNWFRTH